MFFAGIDAGSRAVKIVLYDRDTARTLAAGVADQGVAQDVVAEDLLTRLLERHELQRNALARVVATGYGRNAVSCAEVAVTEITCHARGVRHLLPGARCIVDIGGQDSKWIRLDAHGQVQDFAMNDRCAAGTGSFLEVVARRLHLPLETLGDVASRSANPAAISSTCVVFAESEIVGLLAARTPVEDIVAGVQTAVARRVAGMTGGKVIPPVVFTGGVALVSGMEKALQSALAAPVVIAPQPQFTGALGAALLAAEG